MVTLSQEYHKVNDDNKSSISKDNDTNNFNIPRFMYSQIFFSSIR